MVRATVGGTEPQPDAAAPARAAAGRAALRTAVQALRPIRRRFRRVFASLSVGGMATGLLFFCLSMTPSLLPRAWYLQGVASGICTVTGYAAGVLVGWALRRFGFHPLARPRQRRTATRIVFYSAVVLIPLFGVLGALWQYQVRTVTHTNRDDANFYALVLLIAFTLSRAILAFCRVLRWVTRRIGRFGARWIPVPAAKLIAAVVIGFLAVTILTDALLPAASKLADISFSSADHGTAPGLRPPDAPERSGSPESLVRWSDLGREGRTFVSSGPTTAEIAARAASMPGRSTGATSSAPARTLEPIRVYAGTSSAGTLREEADLVLAELVRTGAFDRAVLVVATTTGRGWVNEIAAAAIEYMWNGNTAIAAMQYSYLPSTVAFLTDRYTPIGAGRILFDTVHAAWAKLPPTHRPKLIVMGESLGAYGSQGTFASLADVERLTDGAVWAGTPNFAPLWRSLTDERRLGSPEQHPNIDGCAIVCFVDRPENLPPSARPSVVFLQHVNDPIVWWSPKLLLNRPQWLAEPALPGRPPSMTWIPLVSFWQVTMDIIFATDMPSGYGHSYGLDYVNAFAAVTRPHGWTAADTARLRSVLAGLSNDE